MLRFLARVLLKALGLGYVTLAIVLWVIFWIAFFEANWDIASGLKPLKDFASFFWSPSDDTIFNILVNLVIIVLAIPICAGLVCLYSFFLLVLAVGAVVQWFYRVSPFAAFLVWGSVIGASVYWFRNPLMALAAWCFAGFMSEGDKPYKQGYSLRKERARKEGGMFMTEILNDKTDPEEEAFSKKLRNTIQKHPEWGIRQPTIPRVDDGWWKENLKRVSFERIRATTEKESAAVSAFNALYSEWLTYQRKQAEEERLGREAEVEAKRVEVEDAELDAKRSEANLRVAKAAADLEDLRRRKEQRQAPKRTPSVQEEVQREIGQIIRNLDVEAGVEQMKDEVKSRYPKEYWPSIDNEFRKKAEELRGK